MFVCNSEESYRTRIICRPKYLQDFPLSHLKQKIRQKIKKVNAKKSPPKSALGSAKICFWKNSKARKLLKLRLLPEGNLIPVNTSGISYFCFLFLFSFYSFKFEKLDQTKLHSHTEVFYNIGCRPITYKSNVACHINSVSYLFPDAFVFRNVSDISKKKLWAVQIIHMLCAFFWRALLSHHKAQTLQFLCNQTPISDDEKQELWYDLQVSSEIWWLCCPWKTRQCQFENKIPNLNKYELCVCSIRTCICRIS